MEKQLKLKDFVLLGRTYEEYCNMFNLESNLLSKNIILDVASGVSSFCAQANEAGFNVTASDKIYGFDAEDIELKCKSDLQEVSKQLPQIQHLYNWTYFSDIEALVKNRKRAYQLFVEDFKKHGASRYVYTQYPFTTFREKQFTLTLVSHFLFLYDEHIDIEFHKKTIQELIRITGGEIRVFPLVNLKGEKSKLVEAILNDSNFKHLKISIVDVSYEFIKGGNQMMVIQTL